MISWSCWFVRVTAFVLAAFLFGFAFGADDTAGAAEPDGIELTDFDDVDGDADLEKRADVSPKVVRMQGVMVGAWGSSREPESPPVDRLLRPPRG